MKKLIIIMAGLFLLIACNHSKDDSSPKDYYYTCSMHPQIVDNHPGRCPICHMDLIKVKRTQSAPDEISLNEEQIRLGNIIVDTLSVSAMGNRQILTATLAADESKTKAVATRSNGRLDRLYHKTTGAYIQKGQPVYSIYSEELNSAKQELITLVQKRKALDNSIINFDQLIDAAKQQLILSGISNTQIESLVENGNPSGLTTFYSPVTGYITELNVMEGDYASEGTTLMRIADLSHLWAEVQVYASQVAQLPENAVVDLEFPDLPGMKVRGRVSFISPELIPDSRIVLARVSIHNPEGKLRPGMVAYVIARPQVSNHLTLPVDAVIRDGRHNRVWLQTRPGIFKWREVETGAESDHRIAIVSGLEEGEKVVTSGAYLLNSEYLLKKGYTGEHRH